MPNEFMTSRAGRLIINVDEEGEPTGNGHYQSWDGVMVVSFTRRSNHAIAWKATPIPWVDKLVRRIFNIPTIDADFEN